ncbi:MAG: hypothetical protein ACTHN5_03465 [Phycisphaerae bacterium]
MSPEIHEPHEDHPAVISRNARIGLGLFVLYFAFYAGFLLLNIFAPRVMSDSIIPLGQDRFLALGGVNLAVGYGIALILMAIFLALVYMRMTRLPLRGTRPGVAKGTFPVD